MQKVAAGFWTRRVRDNTASFENARLRISQAETPTSRIRGSPKPCCAFAKLAGNLRLLPEPFIQRPSTMPSRFSRSGGCMSMSMIMLV